MLKSSVSFEYEAAFAEALEIFAADTSSIEPFDSDYYFSSFLLFQMTDIFPKVRSYTEPILK